MAIKGKHFKWQIKFFKKKKKKEKKNKKKGPSLNWRERTMLARDKPHNPHPNWKNVSGLFKPRLKICGFGRGHNE
jgi:hypothetical protein